MTHPAAPSAETQFRPWAIELAPAPEPVEVFRRMARLPHCLFLDSALRLEQLGRYSFLAADPFQILTVPADGSDAIGPLRTMLSNWRAEHCDELPPFQGGVAGLFGYDLNRSWERIPAPRCDEFRIPAVAVGFFDVVVAFDHEQNRAWIVSQGLPETEPLARRQRAQGRARWLRAFLQGEPPAVRYGRPALTAGLDRALLAPQYATDADPDLTSNFAPEDFRRAIGRVIEYIRAGDVFQVNLAQRLLFPARDDSVTLYLRLRERNAAPFAGYWDMGTWQLASASPERFLCVRDGSVESRPIKGTRPRCHFPEADLFAAGDLLTSEKDRAENVMIVDLLRNDLARVCRPESVRVPELCRLESYRYVQHLVSVVAGQLADPFTPLDLLRAAFPGGSITGAPKVRAMEIIQELEPTARGAYCGSLGYLGFDGTLDLSILIRTVTAAGGWWQFPVGGGIVAQSDPEHEYAETWHKAQGILRALRV